MFGKREPMTRWKIQGADDSPYGSRLYVKSPRGVLIVTNLQGCLLDKIFFFRHGHAGGCIGFVTKSHVIITLMNCFFPSSLSLPPATAATGFI